MTTDHFATLKGFLFTHFIGQIVKHLGDECAHPHIKSIRHVSHANPANAQEKETMVLVLLA